MAQRKVTHAVAVPQPGPARKTPASFQQALQSGWKIVGESTTLESDKRHRHGAVILQMPGVRSKLEVPYTGTIRQGYQFGRPKAA